MLISEANKLINMAVGRPGRHFGAMLDAEVAQVVNDVLETAAKTVEAMSPYDGYDVSTRDSAADLIRDLKIPA